jgi:hypothetical protein
VPTGAVAMAHLRLDQAYMIGALAGIAVTRFWL